MERLDQITIYIADREYGPAVQSKVIKDFIGVTVYEGFEQYLEFIGENESTMIRTTLVAGWKVSPQD